MTMADKIVVMHDGIVEQMGAPLDLYDRPANLFVAGFIGSPAMNFLKGKVRAGASPSFVADSGAVYPLATAPAGSDGRPVTYGIRPENFQLSATGLPAEVVVVEPTGSETQVVAKISGQELVCVFRERVKAGPGETITIAPDPALVHLFDTETGKRLV
jgi:multiple sugar transport system ATP-binding protein